MKKIYLFGNQKMNFNKREELSEYLKELAKVAKHSNNQVGIAVSAPYFYLAEKYLKKSNVFYGAQNCHYENKGAFYVLNGFK